MLDPADMSSVDSGAVAGQLIAAVQAVVNPQGLQTARALAAKVLLANLHPGLPTVLGQITHEATPALIARALLRLASRLAIATADVETRHWCANVPRRP